MNIVQRIRRQQKIIFYNIHSVYAIKLSDVTLKKVAVIIYRWLKIASAGGLQDVNTCILSTMKLLRVINYMRVHKLYMFMVKWKQWVILADKKPPDMFFILD